MADDLPQSGSSAAAPAGGEETAAKPAAKEDSWSELFRVLVYAVALALVVRTFFFQPYNIPSGSMEDTLLVGDYLFVEKFAYGYSRFSLPWGRRLPWRGRVLFRPPHRGDVVVFAPPNDLSTVYIKRLIGLPGDRIQMQNGVLWLNGRPVPKVRAADYVETEDGETRHIPRYRETLPDGKSYFVLDRIPDGIADDTGVYVVPAGHYFMMGDNRDDSNDSRLGVGYVPAENLVGKAQFRFFSIDAEKTKPWQFWTWPREIRYRRIFTAID